MSHPPLFPQDLIPRSDTWWEFGGHSLSGQRILDSGEVRSCRWVDTPGFHLGVVVQEGLTDPESALTPCFPFPIVSNQGTCRSAQLLWLWRLNVGSPDTGDLGAGTLLAQPQISLPARENNRKHANFSKEVKACVQRNQQCHTLSQMYFWGGVGVSYLPVLRAYS